MSGTDTAVAAPALMSSVVYTDTQGKTKGALVIGTPETTDGAIPEGQVSLSIFNPLSGRRYTRRAVFNGETYVSAGSADAPEDESDDLLS